jgi:hypothetical protein
MFYYSTSLPLPLNSPSSSCILEMNGIVKRERKKMVEKIMDNYMVRVSPKGRAETNE